MTLVACNANDSASIKSVSDSVKSTIGPKYTKDPCAAKVNPCASVDPCAAKVNPCASVTKAEKDYYTFSNGKHKVTGSVKIKDRVVKLSDDFSIEEGPDLKIALYEDADPSESLTLEKVLILSKTPFTKFSGPVTVKLDDDVDLSKYKSVVIFCEKYNVNFAYANIK